jgi:hypothetical protein
MYILWPSPVFRSLVRPGSRQVEHREKAVVKINQTADESLPNMGKDSDGPPQISYIS